MRLIAALVLIVALSGCGKGIRINKNERIRVGVWCHKPYVMTYTPENDLHLPFYYPCPKR